MGDNKMIPKDRYHFVYGTVFLLGITSLLPWNFFINANDYWMYKFRDMNDTKYVVDPEYKSDLQTSFTSYLVIASKVPFVLFLLVNTFLSSRISPTIRVTVPLIICFALFCVTAAMVYVDTDYHQSDFLGITLTVVAFINVVAAFLQGAGMGISGALPQTYMKSNVYGQAAGGIFASVVQILTLLGNTSAQASALAYYLCAVVTLAATFGAFIYMKNTPFYKYYMSTQVGNNGTTNSRTEGTDSDQYIRNETSNVSQKEQGHQPRVPLMLIVQQIWVYELTAIILFWVTLTVFPAVVVLVNAVNKDSPIAGREFPPIACFLPFNIFDIVGRILAAYVPLPQRRPMLLLFLSVARVVFIPILMLCNAQPRHLMPVVFDNDICFVLFVILFAITNGYLFSIAMTTGPKVVELQYQEIAGSIMAFCLGLGLMLGSITSYGVVKLL